MLRKIAFWVLLVVCGLALAYAWYLLIANAASSNRLALYPWPGGQVAAVWVILVAMVVGAVLVPLVALLAKVAHDMKKAQEMPGAAGDEVAAGDEGAEGPP